MAEQKMDTLRALADATADAGSVEEVFEAATEVLAESSHDPEFHRLLMEELAAAVSRVHLQEEERRRERALAELDRLREQAAALEMEARQRTEEAIEVRARFMANISHELRTPLNGIIGYLDLLSQGIGGPLTEAQERQIHRIQAGAFRLKEMIEEILTFSRLEAGGEVLELEDTDVVGAVNEVAALVGPLMEDKALAFNVVLPETPRTILTDSGKLRQILLNLLSNAQKYTDRGQVELRVEQEDHTTTIVVRDTGPGIRSQDREKIFRPFQRLPTPDHRGGTGLGLSVSRSLAMLMGGEISLESDVGRGTTFTVRIPTEPGKVPAV